MNLSLTIGDIFRWAVAVALMLVVVSFTLTGSFYVFEFILTHLITLNTFLYLMLWSFAMPTAVYIITTIVSVIALYALRIVRQKQWLGYAFAAVYLLAFVGLLLAFWTSFFTFGWEEATAHQTLNKWLYSLFIFSLITISFRIVDNTKTYVHNQSLETT